MTGRLALALLLAAAPAALSLRPAPARADPPPWRQAITVPDRKRLAGLWKAWTDAKAQVAAAGHADEWRKLGDLVDPGASFDGGPPEPGEYRCRTIKLGTQTPGLPVMLLSTPRPCRIEPGEEALHLVSPFAGQRTSGLLYPDGDRMIYLGAISLGSEPGMFAYRRDVERDQVGILHRIGPTRWRLELPRPRWQSLIDIVEIVPAG